MRSVYGYCPALSLFLLFLSTSLQAQYAGEGVFLDSTGSYAAVGDVSPLIRSAGSPYTVEFWYYLNSTNATLLSGYDGAETTWAIRAVHTDDVGWQVLFDSTDIYAQSIPDETGPLKVVAPFGLNRWNHIAISSDGSTVTFYVNGVSGGSFSDTRTIWRQKSGSAVYIGTQQAPVEVNIGEHGRFDNLRFWTKARSGDEVRAGMAGPLSDRTGLVGEYTFDDGTTGVTYHRNAYIAPAEVPWIGLADGFSHGAALGWAALTWTTSSVLTATSPIFSQGEANGRYLLVGHNNDPVEMRTSTGIAGVKRRLSRVWEVAAVKVPYGLFNLNSTDISDWEPAKGVILVSSDPSFSSDVELIMPTVSESIYGDPYGSLQWDYAFNLADSVFMTVGELDLTDVPFLTADLGYGPFAQSYDNLNTFTLTNLPSGTKKVTFKMVDQLELVDNPTLDSQVVAVSGGKAVYQYQMGNLPVGTMLEIDIDVSGLESPLKLVRQLILTELAPTITSSDAFQGYVLGTERLVTYQVDSLPPSTTAVTFTLVDALGLPFRFIDAQGNTVLMQRRFTGQDMETATWRLELDTLELPLSSQLAVTVEHEMGVPGGTTYTVSLGVLARPMFLFTQGGWGPFVSNNYTRASNSANPWRSVSDSNERFTVTPLPPRTTRVIFEILDTNETVLKSDSVVYNGVNWLTEAISPVYRMSDISPEAWVLRARSISQGGPVIGLQAEHDLEVIPQRPRVFLSPSNYDREPRNRFNPDDHKTTPVTITVEPSTARIDSVVIEIRDHDGSVLHREMKTATTVNGVKEAGFTYDFATLPYTTAELVARVYSPQSLRPIDSVVPLSFVPPRPRMTSIIDAGWYREGQKMNELFTIDKFVGDITRVEVDLAGNDKVSFTKSTAPHTHSVQFTGSSYTEVPVDNGSLTIAFWFRTTEPGFNPLVYAKRTNQPISEFSWLRMLCVSPTGHLVFSQYGQFQLQTPFVVNDGKWHHVAVSHNESTRQLDLYVDGGLVTRDISPHSVVTFSPYELNIGRGNNQDGWNEAPGGRFKGDMSEFAVWKKVLTNDEIAQVVRGADLLTVASGTLEAYLPFSDGEGTTAYDAKRKSRLTIYGSPKWSTNEDLAAVTSIQHIDKLSHGTHNLTATLFYPGSPAEGVAYTWPIVVQPTTHGFTMASDGGFGPFYEGEKAAVLFSTTFDPTPAPGVWIELLDENGNRIVERNGALGGGGTQTAGAATIDMGEAHPGSNMRLWLSWNGDEDFTGKVTYPVRIMPLEPPAISGNTGPFRQSVAPGSMVADNTFRINSYLNNVSFTAKFYDTSWVEIGTAPITKVNDTTWHATYDMALLEPPYTHMLVSTFTGSNPVPARIDTIDITITPTRPSWFSDKSVAFSNVKQQGDVVNFTVEASIARSKSKGKQAGAFTLETIETLLPSEYPLFGSELLTTHYPQVTADLAYDISTDSLWLRSSPKLDGKSNFYGADATWANGKVTAEIDEEKNIIVQTNTTWSLNVPGLLLPGKSLSSGKFSITKWAKGEQALSSVEPVAPYISLKPTVTFAGGSNVHLGNEGDRWGAIGNLDLSGGGSNPASYEYVQLALGVKLGIGVEVLWGIGAEEFDLTLRGVAGVGTSYRTVPQRTTKALGSFAIQLYGELVTKAFWGLYVKSMWGPAMFYNHQWGDRIPELWPHPHDGWIWSGTEKDGEGDPKGSAVAGLPVDTLSHAGAGPPLVFPQAATSVGDGTGTVVWLEQDPNVGRGTLKLASLSLGAPAFSGAVVITSNSNAISNPRVSNLSDSTHLVTWTQARYTPLSRPLNASPVDLGKSLDIWYAVVNSRSGTVEHIGVMEDDFFSDTSGRMEGNADITTLGGEQGLVTWIVADPVAKSSEIYYSVIEKENGIWTSTSPEIAGATSGMEQDLRVVRTPDGKGCALWINRSSPETFDTRLMMMEWEGDDWTAPTPLLGGGDGLHFNDLDVDVEGEYGVIGLTGVREVAGVDTGEVIVAIPWGPNGWDVAGRYEYADTNGYLQRPRASVNAAGLTAVIAQKNNSGPDGNTILSQVDILLADQSTSGGWTHTSAHELLSDTTTRLMDLEVAMIGNLLLVFGHESKTPYTFHLPQSGTHFGQSVMNLVLRAVRIDDALGIADVDESNLTSSVSEPEPMRGETGFDFSTLSPSPFGETATIGYRLETGGAVRLEVIDARGRLVRTLVNEYREGGEYRETLSGKDLANGSYFIRLTVDGESISRTLLKVE